MIFDSDINSHRIYNEECNIFNLDEDTIYLTEGRQKSIYEIEAELERLKNGKSTKFYDFIAGCIAFVNAPLILISTFGVIITCAITALELWPVKEAKKATKKHQLNSLAKQCESSINALNKSNDFNKKQKISELNKLHSKISSEYIKLEKKSSSKDKFEKDVANSLKTGINDYEKSKKKSNEAYVGLTRSTKSNYIYEAYYEDYISNMMSNEEAIARSLNNIIPMNESAYKNVRAITEAKAGDAVKSKCTKFLDFIKNLIAKFMESLNNILLDNKEYLEKYQDIIKKKVPKANLTFTCPGKYESAINRCINTELPVFEFSKYGKLLLDEDEKERTANVVNEIMSNKNDFEYDEGQDLATQFKSYFMALDEGPISGRLSSLNFTDIYNFCYNSSKIKNIVNKDQQLLENSTRNIMNAAKSELASQQAGEEQQSSGGEEQQSSGGEEQQSSGGEEQQSGGGENKPPKTQQNPQSKKPTKLTINTDATSQMSSYSDKSKQDAKDKNKQSQQGVQIAGADEMDENKINQMAERWLSICRIIMTSKMTAVEKIAEDYMTIIRTHVRSYVGKKDNTTDNQADKNGTNYKKVSTKTKEKSQQQKQK